MFPTGDLTRMQVAQEAHMPDTCHRAVYSKTQDEYGATKETWTENITDIPCGVKQGNLRSDNEQVNSDNTMVFYDAQARLPLSQAEVWDVRDRFILVKRFGVSITPITYGVSAPIRRGPSGIQMLLSKVEV